MKQSDRVSDARYESAGCEAISANVDAAAVNARKIFGQAVGLVKRECKLTLRHLKPDMAKVTDRRYAVMRDFVDVEGELCSNVLVLPLGVVDDGAILRAKLGKLDGNSKVGRFRVAHRVSDVVGECANSEG